ncbi:MAG: EAL domain-containing protein [Acidobacteriota bacterium]
MNDPMKHQIILVVDDEIGITEGVAAGLARTGRTIITANDLDGAEMAVEWLNPSHIVSDIRLSGPFAFEGLDFVRFIERCSPESRVILMTGQATDALRIEASHRGVVALLQKPFEISQLDSILDSTAPNRQGSPEWPELMRMPLFDDILTGDELSSVFQPVVRLDSEEYVGYEALTRLQTESPLRNPERLFQYAARKKRIPDLELACVRRSLEAGAGLARVAPIFLNIHPTVFAGPHLEKTILEASERSGVPLHRIVLEITEQGTLDEDRTQFDMIRRLSQSGVRFAFDDVGTAYSHLPFVEQVRPAFLKISQQFGTSFEADETKTKIVHNLLSLAGAFDSELILEGVETAATAAAAKALGIKYAQGYYFARPARAATFEASARR